MVNDIKFRIPGDRKRRLLTYDELIKVPNVGRIPKIRVVDLKTQQNYTASIITIMRKFK